MPGASASSGITTNPPRTAASVPPSSSETVVFPMPPPGFATSTDTGRVHVDWRISVSAANRLRSSARASRSASFGAIGSPSLASTPRTPVEARAAGAATVTPSPRSALRATACACGSTTGPDRGGVVGAGVGGSETCTSGDGPASCAAEPATSAGAVCCSAG